MLLGFVGDPTLVTQFSSRLTLVTKFEILVLDTCEKIKACSRPKLLPTPKIVTIIFVTNIGHTHQCGYD